MRTTSKNKSSDLLVGLNLSRGNYTLLSFLFEAEDDIDFFIKNFWEGVDRQLFAIHDYRCYKIDKLDLSFSEFTSLFEISKIRGLEKLFQQPMKKSYLNILDARFSEGFTLFNLFTCHKQRPEHFIQTHIF